MRLLQVKRIRLVGMMLLVFAAKQHAAHVNHVQSHQVGTGLLGKMVKISADARLTSICSIKQKKNESIVLNFVWS